MEYLNSCFDCERTFVTKVTMNSGSTNVFFSDRVPKLERVSSSSRKAITFVAMTLFISSGDRETIKNNYDGIDKISSWKLFPTVGDLVRDSSSEIIL